MWLICQIGAREHYGIARGLERAGQLGALVTDFWMPPGSLAGRLPGGKRLADRYHPDLANVAVHAPNAKMLGFELLARLRTQHGWPRILTRNALFQREALKILAAIDPLAALPRGQTPLPPSPVPTLFSYSYAALELFRHAKQLGWTTVLGQIDPGPGEDAIVRRLRAQHPEWVGPGETSPPAAYWDAWREECALADRILVNSAWSRTLLIEAGIEAAKIEVVALAFEAEAEEGVRGQGSGVRGACAQRDGSLSKSQTTDLSVAASAEEDNGQLTTLQPPLRVLWLGQVNVRKGIQDLAAAARLLDTTDDAEKNGMIGGGQNARVPRWTGHPDRLDGGQDDRAPQWTGHPDRIGGGQNPRATVDRPLSPDFLSNESPDERTDAPGVRVRIDVVGPHGPLPPGLPNNLIFHGAVPRSEAAAWYEQADVFVLPTHSDGFALTQLEAMAHGVPVIATPCCGEVVEEGINGWLIPAGNPQALADRICWIARNPHCLEPMRAAAKETAGKFGLDRLVRALVEC